MARAYLEQPEAWKQDYRGCKEASDVIDTEYIEIPEYDGVSELEKEFKELAAKWKKETRLSSSLGKIVMHSAYQRIMGMGMPAVPFILRELQRTRGHWLWALHHITGEDPAPENATFREAVDAWLEWGRTHGYIV